MSDSGMHRGQLGPADGLRGIARVRVRILVLSAALATLFIVTTIAAVLVERHAGHTQSLVRAHRSAETVAKEMESIFQSLDATLGVHSRHFGHLPLNQESLGALLQEEIASFANARVMLVTDADGFVVADTWNRENSIGHDASKWPYVQVHQQGAERGLYISPPLESCVDGHMSLPLSHAIRDEQGNLLGVLILSLEPEAFARSLRASVAGHGALRSALLYEDGRVMAASDPSTEPAGGVDVDLEAARKTSGFSDEGYVFIDEKTARKAGTVPSFFGWAPVGTYPLRVAFTLDAAKESEPVHRISRLVVILALVYIAGVGLAMWWLYHQSIALAAQTAISETTAANLEESNASLQQEVAERRQAEGLLREREAEFRAFFETGVVGACEFGIDRRIRRVNERFCQIIGWPREELIGKDMAQITASGELEKNMGVFTDLLTGESEEEILETLGQRKDGTEVPLIVGTRALRDAETGRSRFILQLFDISDRVAAERSLRASELRYRTIAENLPNAGLFVFDPDLRYELVAGRVFEQANLVPAEMVGKTLWECFPEHVSAIASGPNRAAFHGETAQYQVEFQGRTYENHCFPLYDDADQILAGAVIVYDVTDRVRREAERARFMQLSLGLMVVAGFDGVIRQVNPG